jgi:hypothetical protein
MDGVHALCAILHQFCTCPSTSELIKHSLQSYKENVSKWHDSYRKIPGAVANPR